MAINYQKNLTLTESQNLNKPKVLEIRCHRLNQRKLTSEASNFKVFVDNKR